MSFENIILPYTNEIVQYRENINSTKKIRLFSKGSWKSLKEKITLLFTIKYTRVNQL